MEREEAIGLIEATRAGQFEDAFVEAKAARRQLPKRIYEALSAFANHTDGGIIVLGLDEEQNFDLVGVTDPQTVLNQLTEVAANMEPALRLDTLVVEVEGKRLVVAEVPECGFTQKPCFYKPAGMNAGSYIRVGNTNRKMTDYEIFTYVSSRSQPMFDQEPVKAATLDDLDAGRVQSYLDNLRQSRPQLWERLRMSEKPYAEQLTAVGIVARTNGGVHPTLAGLLCFGRWPQNLLPLAGHHLRALPRPDRRRKRRARGAVSGQFQVRGSSDGSGRSGCAANGCQHAPESAGGGHLPPRAG